MGFDINWGLARPVDVGGAFQDGWARGQAQRRETETRNALMDYAQNPNAPGALNALAATGDPRLVMQAQQHQGQMARYKREDYTQLIQAVAKAAKSVKDPATWDAVVEDFARNGYPEAMQYKGMYSPEARLRLMALGGVEDDEPKPTAMQQNYEFLRGRDPKLGETYLQNQADPTRFIQVEDGTGAVRLVPMRSSGAGMGGGSAPRVTDKAQYDALPPGSRYIDPNGVERTKGGAPSQGGGSFR